MAGVDGEFGKMKLSTRDMVALVERFDREMIEEGIPPKARPIAICQKISKEFNIDVALGKGNSAGIQKIMEFHNSLYRTSDLAIGSIHSGLAFHLDLFFRIDFPLVYGTVNLDFHKQSDASETQLARIFSVQEDSESYISDVVDVFDIGACLGNYEGFAQVCDEAMKYFRMAAFHSQAVVALLTGIFDFKGSIQSSLLCAELSIKAALIEMGMSEKELKNTIGHNLRNAVPHLCRAREYDEVELLQLIEALPNFVSSRYDTKDWSRVEVSKIARSAQQLLAIVSREFSGNSFRKKIMKIQ